MASIFEQSTKHVPENTCLLPLKTPWTQLITHALDKQRAEPASDDADQYQVSQSDKFVFCDQIPSVKACISSFCVPRCQSDRLPAVELSHWLIAFSEVNKAP